uniref:DNA-directed RNA polymerase III subunit RPC3 n=1 Tax=Synstelium polycarpum TaxID=361085 RepID=A0A1L2FUP7_9MYCE|nr:RNA polymerase III subunit [Synstelium polycarpum]
MYKNKVAMDIVKEHFGEDVHRVYSMLVNKGKSSLRMVAQACPGMIQRRVRQCLLVLIQHNLVDYEEFLLPPEKKDSGKDTPAKKGVQEIDEPGLSDAYYSANLNNAVHRLRFAKYITYVREKYGDEASVIVEELMDHGRLTMEAVVAQSLTYTNSRSMGFGDDRTKEFEDIFTDLIVDHFIMKVPKPKPIDAGEEEIKASGKDAKKSNTPLSRQQQAALHDPFALPSSLVKGKSGSDPNLIPNLPMSFLAEEAPPAPIPTSKKSAAKRSTKKPASKSKDSSKSKKRKNTGVEEEEEEEFPELLMVSESEPIQIPGESDIQPLKKRAVEVYTVVTQDDQTQQLINEEKRILWRVNYDQFMVEYKIHVCTYRVTLPLDNKLTFNQSNTTTTRHVKILAGLLFMAMVSICKKSIKAIQDSPTTSIFADDILKAYNNNVEIGQQIDSRQLENYLSIMMVTRPSIITKMTAHSRSSLAPESGVYQVNISNIAAVVKQKMVESIVRQKFGDAGLRIFKLLLIKKQLEPKQIAEFAMIPAKESKTLLFTMMERSIVRLQEVPRSSDHFAARTFYLFYVDIANVSQSMVDDVYKAIYNSRERLKAEMAPHADLLTKMESIPDEQLSEDQTKLLRKVERLTDVLETITLNLDNDLMILSAFCV